METLNVSSFESIKFSKKCSKKVDNYIHKCYYNSCLKKQLKLCGYYSKEDTPVPIPNTEVKLLSGDGTWGVTPWESST